MLHTGLDAPGGQALGGRVHRQQRTGLHLRLGADEGMQQFPMGQIAPHPALKVVGLPHHQLVRSVGRVEPAQRQHTGIVRRQHPVHHAAALDAAGRLLLQHGGFDAAIHIKGRAHHSVWFGIVDVAPGKVQQQVPDGGDAQLFKFFGKGRPHAFQVLDGAVKGGLDRHGNLLSFPYKKGTNPDLHQIRPFCFAVSGNYSTEIM